MRKDKNGIELGVGDTVTLSGLRFEITEFRINMKGCNACGEHGCYNVKELEKVEDGEEGNTTS